MFGLSKIRTAIANLVNNVNTLAATIAEVNSGLRSQCRLDEREQEQPAPTLSLKTEGEAQPRNGRSRGKSATATSQE